MTFDLFDPIDEPRRTEQIGESAFVLRGCALSYVAQMLPLLEPILKQAPFRHMVTPGGLRMAVALTNCGSLGWVSDRRGYRYALLDPDSGEPWPALPEVFVRLAQDAAAQAGFPGFVPDACLINRYEPGTRLTLHQDKNEKDFAAPIVSVSLGIPAIFLFGGHERNERTERVPLVHGDVAVWGGVDRLRYHGVMPLKHADHPLLGQQRINLTFRRAG